MTNISILIISIESHTCFFWTWCVLLGLQLGPLVVGNGQDLARAALAGNKTNSNTNNTHTNANNNDNNSIILTIVDVLILLMNICISTRSRARPGPRRGPYYRGVWLVLALI